MQFIWQPYENVIELLPEACRAGRAIWRSVVFLICWNVLEPHVPNRVLRQFGLNQHVPEHLLVWGKPYHGITRRGRSDTNWSTKHCAFVEVWNDRFNRIAGDEDDTCDPTFPTPEYESWYLLHTIRYISRPIHGTHTHGYDGSGTAATNMAEALQQLYHMSLDEDVSNSYTMAARAISSTSLRSAGEERRLTSQPIPWEKMPIPDNIDPRSIQRTPRSVRRRTGTCIVIREDMEMSQTSNQDIAMNTPTFPEFGTPYSYAHTSHLEPQPSSSSNPTFQYQTPRHLVNNEDEADNDDDIDEEFQCDPIPPQMLQVNRVRKSTRIPIPTKCGTHGKLPTQKK